MDACPSPVGRPDPWLVAAAPALASLPPGRALDLACGAGRNALWLAERGVVVVGVDASPERVERARGAARARGVPALFETDVLGPDRPLPAPDGPGWAAVLVFHYLDRLLYRALPPLLAAGGVVVMKTHLRHRLRGPDARPRRPAYLLEPGELLGAFPGLVPLRYAEWAVAGQAFAGLVARRPRGRNPTPGSTQTVEMGAGRGGSPQP